ncbi:uncharacterized protein SAPINGB_P003037 [Magnusiomyces paraingens]|uniref:Amino acid permease/ SLC12A domain-containing protein n=1 Tax=Magnusiomyces paraingens TaxID=2606893 RepID=A0A5E8BK45_9ASCO|nr:uncharacterized protein SAPINGB_P003037 [Saprochaete ingens]VVT51259.1 unnamed protein product [Saprochaete ingens]
MGIFNRLSSNRNQGEVDTTDAETVNGSLDNESKNYYKIFSKAFSQRDMEKNNYSTNEIQEYTSEDSDNASTKYEQTHRKLKSRHIQLIGIGGTIGTGLFIQIGNGLVKGGPGSLLLAFIAWCIPILCVTSSTAEMVSYLPLSSPFIQLAGRCVDEAFEVMCGWNFFLFEAIMIPFELTAVNVLIHYWREDYSPAIPMVLQLVIYFLINVFAVDLYGESEYWMAMGKVILAVGMIIFTFVTMVGGNPQHHAYGFQFWKDPGSFLEYLSTGSWGRFLGFFACLTQAAFTIAGPEYISMAAGECVNPQKVMPKAFKSVFYRLITFFILGALSVGIVVSSRDPNLIDAITNGNSGSAASPYIVGMTRMKINVLPHIVNVLILSSAFSAGNSYVYCSSRTLYGLALQGHAPKIFTFCTKKGVPIVAVVFSLAFGFLGFLQLGKTASTVLNWIVNLVTVSQVINFCTLCVTYVRFYYALKAQGIDRRTLPYRGYFQPYAAYIGMVCTFAMMFLAGYPVFVDWDVPTFIFSYIMIPICVFVFLFWKIVKKTKFKKASEVDLFTGLKEIQDHVDSLPPDTKPITWYGKLGAFIKGD